jgi:DNA-binding NarL/FixJ family response regulator
VRVGLADDSQLFRDGLMALLEASGVEVVLQAGTGAELLRWVDLVSLDVVVLDIRMPPTFTEEGLDAADALRRDHPELGVLVLSTYAETTYAVRTFRQGAAGRGYLLKDAVNDPGALRSALERLQAGGSVLDQSIVQRLMTGTRRRESLAALTVEQRTILRLVAEGYDDVGIGEVVDSGTGTGGQAVVPVPVPVQRQVQVPIQVRIDDALKALGIAPGPAEHRLMALISWLRSESTPAPE